MIADALDMVRICDLFEVGEEILKVSLEGHKPLGVTSIDGAYYVFPDTCPHASESLSKGWVEDGRIVCPVHFAEFELGNGAVHNGPSGCAKLTFYECEARSDGLYARLTS